MTSVRQSCGEQLQEAKVLLSLRASRPVGFLLVLSGAHLWLSPHPHTVLSLALAGGIPSPLPPSLAPPSSARTPSLVRRSEAHFLGSRPCCLGGPREGAQDPEPSLMPPPHTHARAYTHTQRGQGGWEVGGGWLAREGKS